MLSSRILSEEISTSYDVIVSARENDSDILNKVNEGSAKDMAYSVLDLKVSGTINSYDIIAIRIKMLNLRKIDLSNATITASSYEYYTGCHTENNIIGDRMFSNMNLHKLILPNDIISIGN